MELRVAEYSDYERIAQLHAQSWKDFYKGIYTEDYLTNDVLPDRMVVWQTRLINPAFNQHVLLAEEGGLLMGFICGFGNHDIDKGSIIESLHVDKAYRGRGIGKRLLNEMASWMNHYFPDQGVYLEVLQENKQAHEFYDHFGGENLHEKTWQAPCGSQIPELVIGWKSPQKLLESYTD
ncbi:GNAT family N-acetyltransferase [Vibrio sonorensis]|uniref:GNAT family N-acetyltransferase n=1 Tax=Vibrio sonorensis TaxID=1004316 RepID=UPI0008DA96B0|nr:GNAT family N-acetyltransferase [Vibrio sonorensis]